MNFTLRASNTVRRVGKTSLTSGREVTGLDNLQIRENFKFQRKENNTSLESLFQRCSVSSATQKQPWSRKGSVKSGEKEASLSACSSFFPGFLKNYFMKNVLQKHLLTDIPSLLLKQPINTHKGILLF